MFDHGLVQKKGAECYRPPEITTGSLIERLKAELPHPNRVVPSLKPKSGGEVAGPCPKCGGNDRFYIRADGSFGCRKCNPKGGDVVDFHMWINDTDLHGLADVWLNDRQSEERLPKAQAIDANLTKTYSYTDEAGNELFQVCRYEAEGCEKTFRQRHRRGNSYVKNLDGVRRVLYRLPEVMVSDYIVLTEGEKDVDNLAELGIASTTSPMGASNWQSEYAEALRGKYIAIFPDNDKAGQKYVDDVTKSLHGIAASIRVVKLPGLAEKGDVSDWLEAGGTREQLISLIQATPEIKQKTAKEDHKFRLVHISEIENKVPDWLIKNMMEFDTLIEFFSDPGSGKTFLAVDIAACVATGKAFHGKKVRQGPVIYIAGEGQNGIKRRFMAWAIRHDVDIDKAPLFISLIPAALCDADQAEYVMQAVRSVAEQYEPPALIEIDTVARSFGPGDENSTKDMTTFIQALDSLRSLYHSAVLLCHHSGHGDKTRARGAMALKGALDAEYRLDKDKQGVIRVECTKMKDFTAPEPMAFRLRTVELPIKDEDGKPVTSAILGDTSYEPPVVKGKTGRGKWQTVAVEILKNLYREHQQRLESAGLNPDTARVSVDDWRAACVAEGMSRQAWARVLESVPKSHGVEVRSGYVDL